jgi:hypothetical protein
MPRTPRQPVQSRRHIGFNRFAICHRASLSRKEARGAKCAFLPNETDYFDGEE